MRLISRSKNNENLEISCRQALPLTPQHQSAYSLYYSLYISYATDKENLFNNQEPLKLGIISFILMTLMSDSRVIL